MVATSEPLPEPAANRSPPVGLVAGGGRFPFEVVRAARRRGHAVACVGIRHEVSPELAAEVDDFKLLGLGRFGAAMRYFRKMGVRRVSWAGWIRKDRLFTPRRILSLLPDWRLLRLWFFRLKDHRSQTLLLGLARELESEGFTLTHSAEFCPELLVPAGVLTRRAPGPHQLVDIRFGWKVAKRMADLDVGQSVAVYERNTIAVEGMEGTDRNIRRAGELCRKRGMVVVKVAKEGHDMRFDVPTIGPQTIETLHRAGGSVLAVEAGKTLVLERQKTVELADRLGIVVVAYEDPEKTL